MHKAQRLPSASAPSGPDYAENLKLILRHLAGHFKFPIFPQSYHSAFPLKVPHPPPNPSGLFSSPSLSHISSLVAPCFTVSSLGNWIPGQMREKVGQALPGGGGGGGGRSCYHLW